MGTQKMTFTAFADERLIAEGSLNDVVLRTKAALDGGEVGKIALFEDQTGRDVDIDYRGTPDEVITRLAEHPRFARPVAEKPKSKPTGPGRPKLGVVSREVTLLPRHWDWLGAQPGGASGTLRRLVDEARREGRCAELARQAGEAVHSAAWHLAGSYDHFEEVMRAFDRGELATVAELTASWTKDVRSYLLRLIERAQSLKHAAAKGTEQPTESSG